MHGSELQEARGVLASARLRARSRRLDAPRDGGCGSAHFIFVRRSANPGSQSSGGPLSNQARRTRHRLLHGEAGLPARAEDRDPLRLRLARYSSFAAEWSGKLGDHARCPTAASRSPVGGIGSFFTSTISLLTSRS